MSRTLNAVLLLVLAALCGCASPPSVDERFVQALSAPYRLDSGDRLRIVVYDETKLTSTYVVADSGAVSMPLIGDVSARGLTTRELETAIVDRLNPDYLRNPSVSVQIDTYRPFFILGEVQTPGQYPYVDGLTAERAVAIGGGFTPRAVKYMVRIQRRFDGTLVEARVPIDHPIRPGDTIYVLERWF
jgi:polysaccharide biosynthesis/export protein